MKKLKTATNQAEIGFYKGLLEHEGIHCLIKNEFLSGASGELPVNETWPEIWVADDELDHAKAVLQSIETNDEAEPWRCEQCHQLIEPQFAVCWHCATNVTPD